MEKEENLTVKVPVGVEEWMAWRIPGHGLASHDPRGVPGDLFVVIRTAPDARFERRGEHLWHAETIAVPDAVLGVQLEVPTLGGRATVTVPAGTRPGDVLRLRGKGLPEFGGRKRGDLFVALNVRVPKRPTTEERELYERLRRAGAQGSRKGKEKVRT